MATNQTSDLLNGIQSGDADAIGDAFVAAMRERVASNIEAKKVEVAKNILGEAALTTGDIDCAFPQCGKKATDTVPYDHHGETIHVHVCKDHLENLSKEKITEIYSDSAVNPRVTALIKRGYKLVKSYAGKDVLKGPNGEHRVVRMKKGKVDISESAKWNEDNVDQHPELKRIRDEYEYQEGIGSWGKGYHHHSDDNRYYRRAEDLVQAHARKRKELLATVTESEQINEIGNTPEGIKRVHKYIVDARIDLDDLGRTKTDDEGRKARAEEAKEKAKKAGNKDDEAFFNDRVTAFEKSLKTTDKKIKNRKTGLAQAAKIKLKSKIKTESVGGPKEPMLSEENKIWHEQDENGNMVVHKLINGKKTTERYSADERSFGLQRVQKLTKLHVSAAPSVFAAKDPVPNTEQDKKPWKTV